MRSVGLPDVRLSLGSTDLHIHVCRLQSGNFLLGGEGATATVSCRRFSIYREAGRISTPSQRFGDFLALRHIPSIRVRLAVALSCVSGAAAFVGLHYRRNLVSGTHVSTMDTNSLLGFNVFAWAYHWRLFGLSVHCFTFCS